MLEQFLNHIQHHNLCNTTDKILLAVSGGVDSMVMLRLFHDAGYTAGVAHCNFGLRGKESDKDEAFVEDECRALGVPVWTRRFDTSAFAESHGLSVQMAARQLRYPFFNELIEREGYRAVATAHHRNDSIETVILHLARGSGIDGLTGIPRRNERIIRPLLFASREQIGQYAAAHGIRWREDPTNASDDYQRNLVRNKIIPVLKDINPNLEQTFGSTLERLQGARRLVRLFIEEFSARAVSESGEQMTIAKKALAESGAAATLLWEIVKQKGFNFEQCREVTAGHQPGRTFLSEAFSLFIDRDHIIVRPRSDRSDFAVTINAGDTTIREHGRELIFSRIEKSRFHLLNDSTLAQLDHDKVRFPMRWRSWRPGDAFVPLGMSKSKKLSDFLIDKKVSLPDKEKITVLESSGTIIWVVGMRIHDHFKVTDGTAQVLTVRFQENGEG